MNINPSIHVKFVCINYVFLESKNLQEIKIMNEKTKVCEKKIYLNSILFPSRFRSFRLKQDGNLFVVELKLIAFSQNSFRVTCAGTEIIQISAQFPFLSSFFLISFCCERNEQRFFFSFFVGGFYFVYSIFMKSYKINLTFMIKHVFVMTFEYENVSR